MARSTWSFLIGIISTFVYSCLTLFYIVYSLYSCGYIFTTTEDYEDIKESTSFLNIYVIVCDLLTYIAMVIASIFLQIGAKQDRYQLFAPWLVLSGLVIAVAILGLIPFQSFSNFDSIINLSVIVFQILMSLFIFTHYRELRHQEKIRRDNCERQRNGTAYYIGRTSNSVYAPTTECDNDTIWSVITLTQQQSQ